MGGSSKGNSNIRKRSKRKKETESGLRCNVETSHKNKSLKSKKNIQYFHGPHNRAYYCHFIVATVLLIFATLAIKFPKSILSGLKDYLPSDLELKRQNHNHTKTPPNDDIFQYEDWDKNDPLLLQNNIFLSDYVCNDLQKSASKTPAIVGAKTFGKCHQSIVSSPKRRTHYASKPISKGSNILTLPRKFLIWDLDSMRDPFIQRHMFPARHEATGNPLDSGAFLAAYLIRRYKKLKHNWSWPFAETDEEDLSSTQETDRIFLEYMDILPTFSHYLSFHPILMHEDEILELLGKSTPTYNLVHAYKSMILSEYQAMVRQSPEFENNVNTTEYFAMRINVMSRSFGTGPPGPEEAFGNNSIKDEINFYFKKSGVDLGKGCRAMSPILDMWDHHSNSNVNWRYHGGKERAFLINSVTDIPAGQDIIVSYGKYTDTHLYAKFGFVNGDGSGYTEASIATMHRLLDVGTGSQFSHLRQEDSKSTDPMKNSNKMVPTIEEAKHQKEEMLQYLSYDDGYQTCIKRQSNPSGYTLKLLKYHHLLEIANLRDRWTIQMKPRNPKSNPSASSNMPILNHSPKFDPKSVQFDGSKLISTCRLLSLTELDYDGKAIDVLSSVLRNKTAATFLVKRQTEELEFRALNCLARLSHSALAGYNTTVPQTMMFLDDNLSPFGSIEWTAAQVILGEMQTLEVLKSISMSGAKQMLKNRHDRNPSLDKRESSLIVRRKPCPIDFSLLLE
mmetsp:Transcript_14196/g.20273  ORF Transcript_14196/g.20273 Transcript_14196/m.20273 type:complete len:731 (+) Transcript_14196:70-2262(+)